MPRRIIGPDDEALAKATSRTGSTVEKGAVNATSREPADQQYRAEAIARMRQLVAEGEVDLSAFPVGNSGSGKPASGPSPA